MNNKISHKAFVIIGFVSLISIIYLLQIASFQIFNNKYQLSAENNAIKRKVVYPARGLIFDRNNNLLVYNKAYYELYAIPIKITEFDTTELCQILDITKDFLIQKLKQARHYSKWKESKIYGPFDKKTYSILAEKMFKYPGFSIHKLFERVYAHPIAPHLLGYLQEVSQKVIDTSNYYKMGDIMGVTGIEKTYENVLRGRKGVNYYVVDVRNHIVGPYKKGKYDTTAIIGKNIVCTIDSKLQAYGEKLMQNKRGAIVAIEPSTGEVLCLVSSPDYDPNMLTLTKLRKNFSKLLLDPKQPLFNRAIGSGQSPPGSTFKVVDAVIGLHEGVITTQTVIPCYGGFRLGGGQIVRCHHGGPVDFYSSISSSCNTYYCNVFVRILNNKKKYKTVQQAYKNWYEQLNKFCIGKKTGIDLPSESSGSLYNVEKYNKIKGKNWGALNIISLAIGQGEMGLTALQLATVASIMANRGYYYTPHVVKKIENGKINPKFTKRNYVGIDSTYFVPVIDGMEQVTKWGTAAGIHLPNLTQCGKTGTAQNERGLHNSIFIEFAPKYNPKIAIAVYVNDGGYGAETAAPIASLMVEKYLTDTITRPYLEQYILNKNLMNVKPQKKK